MLSELLYKAGRIVIGSYARLMLKMDVHWHDKLPKGPVKANCACICAGYEQAGLFGMQKITVFIPIFD